MSGVGREFEAARNRMCACGDMIVCKAAAAAATDVNDVSV